MSSSGHPWYLLFVLRLKREEGKAMPVLRDYALSMQRLCQNAHCRHLPRNLRSQMTSLEPNHPPLFLRYVSKGASIPIQLKIITRVWCSLCYSTCGFYVAYLKVLSGQKSAETFFSKKISSSVSSTGLKGILELSQRKTTQHSVLCFETLRIYYSASKCSKVMLVGALTLLFQPTNIISCVSKPLHTDLTSFTLLSISCLGFHDLGSMNTSGHPAHGIRHLDDTKPCPLLFNDLLYYFCLLTF